MRTGMLMGAMLCVLGLAGCGGGANSAGETIAAPVDNIDKNVKYMQETEKDLKKIGNANKEAVDKMANDRVNKK